MSETVKSVFLNYITCAIFGGILEYIAPEKMRKVLRTCVVAIMLITSVAPVLKIEFDISSLKTAQEQNEEEQYNALMHTASLIEKKLYGEIKNILIKTGADEYEIYITTNAQKEENTVYLEEIKIEVDKTFEDKIPEIKKQISKEYEEILKIGVKNE